VTHVAKAIRLDQYGGPEVLQVVDTEVPAPPPGEVLVAVRAAGINPGEAAIRRGNLDKIFPTTFPSGEGSDLAGVVSQVGDGADSFAVGDEVMGWTDRRASHAECVSVPTDHLIHKPKALSWEVAGSLYVVGVTAYASVRAVDPGPNDTVVVSAAAGGVGSVVVQLLKVRGSQIIGIASETNHAWLRSLGAEPVAYGDGLADRIRAAATSGPDAFIDTHGGDYVQLAIELGIDPNRINTIASFSAAKQYGVKMEGNAAGASAHVLAEMAELVASGRVSIPIAATYPLDQVRAAYDELEKGHTHGKIVLTP
jgi:NADPH:quinone reductase-like Zn-dependent oxidoreductase